MTYFFRGISRLDLFLKILLIGASFQSLGYASNAIRQKLSIHTSYLLELGFTPILANALIAGLAIFFIVSAILTLYKPTPKLLLATGIVIFVLTAVKASYLGSGFALTLPARASRYLLPLLLSFMLYRKSNPDFKLELPVATILKFAIASTFIAHGMKALMHSSSFVGYIQSFTQIVFNFKVSDSTTFVLLDIIGLADVVAAILLLSSPKLSRYAMLYMGTWALMAASSRMFQHGPIAFDQVLIRAAYISIPISLFFTEVRPKVKSYVGKGYRLPGQLGPQY